MKLFIRPVFKESVRNDWKAGVWSVTNGAPRFPLAGTAAEALDTRGRVQLLWNDVAEPNALRLTSGAHRFPEKFQDLLTAKLPRGHDSMRPISPRRPLHAGWTAGRLPV